MTVEASVFHFYFVFVFAISLPFSSDQVLHEKTTVLQVAHSTCVLSWSDITVGLLTGGRLLHVSHRLAQCPYKSSVHTYVCVA